MDKSKKEYNKALNRYNNMINNVPEEKQKANYEYVEEIIKNCNDKLNEIGEYQEKDILEGF